MDKLTKEKRSWNMSRIPGKNTRPELTVRSLLHQNGYRFTLQRKDLPGRPDIVLPKYNAVIFVHGCFWHVHECPAFKWPSSRREWWEEKLRGNKDRDERNLGLLLEAGLRVCIVWECSLKGKHKLPPDIVIKELSEWLKSENRYLSLKGGDTSN